MKRGPQSTPTRRPAPVLTWTIPEDLVEIGLLTRAHGLKGEIRVAYYAESLDLLRKDLWLQAGAHGKIWPVRLLDMRLHQDQVIIRLEGVDDRSAAERLRGVSLMISEAALPEPDDGSLYQYALLGLRVVHQATGQDIGVLRDIDDNGSQELWIITSPEGAEILFPAVPEFVRDVDLDAGIIQILPPEGLLELYLDAAPATNAPRQS